MSLLIVITSYKATDLTIDCLNSLEHDISQIPDAKVGICENGNEDDTAVVLQEEIKRNGWQDWVYVKSIMPNRGFSGGNNVILRDALALHHIPDFFLLLNADTIVRPGALIKLMEAAKNNPKVGVIGPRLEWPWGEGQVSSFRFISPLSEMIASAGTGPITQLLKRWDVPLPLTDKPTEVEWCSFACALIRKEVFFDIGVLDEGYYLYFDDVDYCRSAIYAGWRVLYLPQSRVVHLRGQSNPVKENTSRRKRRPLYWYVSRSWYFSKFYGKSGLLLANLLWTCGRVVSLLREIVGNKKPHLCRMEEIDIWKGFMNSVKPKTNINSS